jgi:membrane protease YdiL (CAAX protease family)
MRHLAVLQLASIFVLPVALLLLGIVPMSDRFLLLGLSTLAVCAIVVAEGWTLRELGIRRDNLARAAGPYLLFTALGLTVIAVFAWILGRQPMAHWWTNAPFLLAIVPLSMAQEFLFRGFLLRALRRLFASPTIIILSNALLFAGMHLLYPGILVGWPLALAGGIGFAVMYRWYPNLPLISLSHSVLNWMAVLFFFFTFAPASPLA